MKYVQVIVSTALHTSSSLPTISISKGVVKKLQIPVDTPLLLWVSNQPLPVSCQVNSAKSNNVEMNTILAQRVGIPDQAQLYLGYDTSTQSLRLGPVFAILVSRESKADPPFSPLNSFCKEVLRYARRRHLLAYVVTLEELSNASETVRGWVYWNQQWRKERLPYPQIIYNRISSRRIERKDIYKELVLQLRDQHIVLFNESFLNKWEVYEKLKASKELRNHLPETQLFRASALKKLLEKYSVVFIKPIHGSLGRGIYRVRRLSNGYETAYTTLHGQLTKHFSRLSSLYHYFSKRIQPNKNIIQEGIPLLRLQGRTIDFRALMQKNQSGEWGVTSLVARISPEHKFVSNVARGGTVSKVKATLEQCRVTNSKQASLQLIRVARKACQGIEQQFDHHFGELGIDLAMSQSGEVHILEVNSRPSKTDDTLPVLPAKGRPSVHRLLDYTLFLFHS